MGGALIVAKRMRCRQGPHINNRARWRAWRGGLDMPMIYDVGGLPAFLGQVPA